MRALRGTTTQRGYRAVTITFCDTYCLSTTSMQKVMAEYPSVRKHFRGLAVVKIVCEKIIYAAKLVKSLSAQMVGAEVQADPILKEAPPGFRL